MRENEEHSELEKINRLEIDEFLLNLTTVERTDELQKAISTILAIGYDGLANELDSIMRIADSKPLETTLDDVCALINNVQDGILKTHGITIYGDAPINIKDSLIDAIVLLPDYYDPEQLLSSFQLGITEDLMSVFEDLLEELLGEDKTEDILEYRIDVTPRFFTALKRILENSMAKLENPDTFDLPIIEQTWIDSIKALLEFKTQSTDLILPQRLGSVIPFKLPLSVYLAELALHYRETDLVKNLAIECLIATKAAGIDVSQIYDSLTPYFSSFFTKELDQMELMTYIKAILGELGHAY